MTNFTQSIVMNRYQLVRAVGDGRMSNVFLADDLRNPGHQVAIKLLDTAHPDDIRHELFRRETFALERLSHPNIVKLLDHGFWDDRNCFYVVLEWLEDSLSQILAKATGQTMTRDASAALLHDIADALVYAHSEGVIHRDIKPGNILFDSAGTPKLSDFGISKLRDHLSIGLTLANFFSGGYAPPEQGRGEPGDERSDLYSFGSVAFHLISGEAPPPSGFQPEDVRRLVIDTKTKTLLTSLLDPDPAKRPASAGAVRTVFRGLVDQIVAMPPVLMLLTAKAIKEAAELGLIYRESLDLAKEWFISEFGGEEMAPVSCHLREDGTIRMVGRETRLACMRSEGGTCLIVRGVETPYGPTLEASRRSGFSARYLWQPVSESEMRQSDETERRQSEEGIEELFNRLTAHNRKSRVQREQRVGRRNLLEVCERLLAVQQRFVDSRSEALPFNHFDITPDLLVVHLAQPAPDDLGWSEGSSMAFFSANQRGEHSAGQLVEVSGNRVLIARDRYSTDKSSAEPGFPSTGSIGISVQEHLAALRRQQYAINRMRSGDLANPKLMEVLSDLRKAEFDRANSEITFFQDGLDTDKREAVSHALSANDIFLIQGPPGTGKTTVITELLLQILKEKPAARILVSSQSNVPVNHVLSRMDSLGGNSTPEIVRIGRADKIRQGAERWQLAERVERWRSEVVQHCKDLEVELRAESRQRGKQVKRLKSTDLDESSLFECQIWLDEAIAILLNLEEAQRQVEVLKSDQAAHGPHASPYVLDGELANLVRSIDVWSKEISDHVQSVIDLLPAQFDVAPSGNVRQDVERLRDMVVLASTPGDASDPNTNIIKLLQDWSAVFGRTPEFQLPILQRANVIAATCLYAGGAQLRDQTYDWAIIDEAGRATATELLIPLVRARRIILVGDERQLPPMLTGGPPAGRDEAGGSETEDLHQSLFERLVRDSTRNAPDAIRMLRTQHRMHPAIGDLISEVFYEGALDHGVTGSDRLHGLPWAEHPVMWLSTSDLPNHNEIRRDTSYSNMAEVEVVTQVLEWMEQDFQHAGESREIGVIAGYSGQVSALHDRIFPEDKIRWQRLDIEIATVDAFQGRDRDIVIYSAVRSNPENRIGFLRDARRLNVALSRAKQLLVIVGDARMYSQAGLQIRENPFRTVLTYIEGNPHSCSLTPWSPSLRSTLTNA